MCIICIDFQRGVLKSGEARRALGEMRASLDPAHVREVEEALEKAEALDPANTPQPPVPASQAPPTKP